MYETRVMDLKRWTQGTKMMEEMVSVDERGRRAPSLSLAYDGTALLVRACRNLFPSRLTPL